MTFTGSDADGFDGYIDKDELVTLLRSREKSRAHKGYQRSAIRNDYPYELLLTTAAEADIVVSQENTRFSERDFFGQWVRGQMYQDLSPLDGLIGKWDVFSLVPEPHNPYDQTAIAVEFLGKKIGYLSSNVAASFHWKVRLLNRDGIDVKVSGLVAYQIYRPNGRRYVSGIYVLLPTNQFLPEYEDYDEALESYNQRLQDVWQDLDSDVKERILRIDGWRYAPDEDELQVFYEATKHHTDLLYPNYFDADRVPGAITYFLYDQRKTFKKQEQVSE